MASIELSLFGGFRARLESGQEVALPTKKSKLLFARLALPPGEGHTREQLIGLLWSERREAQGRASLRQALTALRKALSAADPPPLRVIGETISLDPAALEVDVASFERLVDSGAVQDLERAVALYRGALLDGVTVPDQAFETWLSYERERLRERQLGGLANLLDHKMAEGAVERAIETAQRLLSFDALREDAHRALMRLYAEHGQRGRALRQYQLCCDILGRELGVQPEAETKRLYDDIREQRLERVSSDEPPAVKPAADTSTGPLKPSIAVLPFINLSGDREQSYFSDGITEDIITQLSRFPTLFVIARNSSFAQRDKAGDVTVVARELGVHYVVEGSVRKVANRVRISTQLVDGVTGHHLWAERYDRKLEDIFAVQDEVTQTIVATLAGRLEVAGQRRAKRKNTESLEAYDYVLRGNECFYSFTKEDNDRARKRYQQAIELDLDCARAHLGLAWSELMGWLCHWSKTPGESFDRAFESAKKALGSDDSDSLTHAILGELYLFRREYEQAEIHLERALALNPNDADAIGIMGFLLTCLGRPKEGIEHFKTAKRLNPYQPDWCMFCWRFGIAQYTAGNYDSAVTAMKEIVSPINDVRVWLSASYAQAGKPDEARSALEEFLRVVEAESEGFRGRTLAAWKARWAKFFPFKNDADLRHFLDGLRKAGLPE